MSPESRASATHAIPWTATASVGLVRTQIRCTCGNLRATRTTRLPYSHTIVLALVMTCRLPPPPPPPDPSRLLPAEARPPLEPAADVLQAVAVPAQSPPVTPAAPLMSGAAPPDAAVLVVVEPFDPGFPAELTPCAEPDPPPWARRTLPLPNVAMIGETSRMPPPLPAPPLPSLLTLEVEPGEKPPDALR